MLAFLLLRFVTPPHTPYDGPLHLAARMLQGKVSLAEDCTWWETFTRDGKHYLVYSPLASALLVPYVLAGGLGWGMPVANTLFLLGATALLWRLFRGERFLRPWADVAAVAYLCGTPLLYSASRGDVWLLIHSQGNLLLLAALLAARRRRWLWVGFWFAAAVCCRNALVFAAPFLLVLLWRGPVNAAGLRRFARRAGRVALGAVVPAAAAFWLNAVMTGDPRVTTYRMAYDEWGYGQLYSLEHLRNNLKFYFLEMPQFSAERPYVRFPREGQAFWVVSPFFLLLLRARLHTRFLRAALVGAICGFVPYLCFLWNGYAQYGSRYVTDVFPFLLPLTFSAVSRGRPVRRETRVLVWMAVVLSVLINLVAVLQRFNGMEPLQ